MRGGSELTEREAGVKANGCGFLLGLRKMVEN